MKGYKKNGYKISKDDFDKIKRLSVAGLSAKEIHEVLGWGATTIAKCVGFDSIDDYQAYLDDKKSKLTQKQPVLAVPDQLAQNELDLAIDDWKVAFDNKLTEIDSNLVEVKMMVQSLSNNKKGFWK